MNWYERLRFVANLQSEHVDIRLLGFSKSNVVYCGLKYPFC